MLRTHPLIPAAGWGPSTRQQVGGSGMRRACNPVCAWMRQHYLLRSAPNTHAAPAAGHLPLAAWRLRHAPAAGQLGTLQPVVFNVVDRLQHEDAAHVLEGCKAGWPVLRVATRGAAGLQGAHHWCIVLCTATHRLAASGSCLCSPDECLTHSKGQPRPAVEHESGGGERQRAAHPPHHPACEAACMPAVVISWAGSREA